MTWKASHKGQETYLWDLSCNACPALYLSRGRRYDTLAGARARGWHCYDGPTYGGDKELSEHLCPSCAGNAKRLPKIENLDGQEKMF